MGVEAISCIFVHGLGQTSSSWDGTVSLVSAPQIYCVDLFALLKDKESNYENLYHSFASYCNAISGKLNLCGLSLGGVLALNYAIDYPNKVKSLVLIAAQYRMPKILLKLQNIIFHFAPNKSFAKIGFSKNDTMQLTNSMVDLDFSKELKKISCTALILCGKKDYGNKKAAKNLSERIPNATLYLIDDIAHEVNITSSDKLADILNKYWKHKNQNKGVN